MTEKRKMDSEDQGRTLVRELNGVITCKICGGYLIDATTLVDCFHVFCRACLLRHFENTKTGCPTCNTLYKKKAQPCFRPDPQVQSLVYKLVPSLYAKELQRREDFYRRTESLRASSSCSEDSAAEREREIIRNHREEMLSSQIGDRTLFLSPDDSISLSLEYYQAKLDTTDLDKENTSDVKIAKKDEDSDVKCSNGSEKSNGIYERRKSVNGDDSEKDSESATADKTVETDIDADKGDDTVVKKECDKRYLQCPAAVLMKHLQKFIRLKNGLTADHKVDIIYKGEVLPQTFSLMDVAYTFKWQRMKPMRFFYRIFIPTKIKPIKIVNTTLSTGGKQLQIVPVETNIERSKTPERKEKTPEKKENTPEKEMTPDITVKTPEKKEESEEIVEPKKVEIKLPEETEDQRNRKERLFAHLQLQSKSQAEESKKAAEKPPAKDCVFEYQEPDQEEIKEFAEERDREWAMQKKLDEKKKEEEFSIPHVSKKRKKNKHSKNEFNVHKKRKLHAEIASNEEELKLKVKITNNGHKHKHHKSSGQVNEKNHTSSASSKEKLLQMRQVRHKHSNEEKQNNTPSNKVNEDIKKLKIKVSEPSSIVSESAVLPKQQTDILSTSPKIGTLLEPSTSKTDLTVKTPLEPREWGKKPAPVTVEKNEKNDKAQKTFHAYVEKYHKNEKIQQTKIENAKIKQMNFNRLQQQIKPDNTKMNNMVNKNFAKVTGMVMNVNQKLPDKMDKKLNFATVDKAKVITPHYPPGFTVSKVEQGVKRKADSNDSVQDKRPSLEITLITPPTTSPVQQSPRPNDKPPVKRPPPATIPLDRIKKSVNLKSGVSIIPKMSEVGPLDLSNPNKSPEAPPKTPPKLENTNGFSVTNRQMNALPRPIDKPNMSLSNLQMLSNVAIEHTILNNKGTPPNNVPANKPRPQIPNLQTLKIPSMSNPGQMKSPNLQKMPKLNEIHKFRPANAQIRNIRPNQNQNIRNIPNPSLLIRQQNQNRLNSQISIHPSSSDGSLPPSPGSMTTSVTSVPASSPGQSKDTTTTISAVKSIIEPKIQEKKELTV